MAAEFGDPYLSVKEVAEVTEPVHAHQWGFHAEDGTKYESLTEVIDATVAKFGMPDMSMIKVEVKEPATKANSHKWTYIADDGTTYNSLTEVIDATAAKYGGPYLNTNEEVEVEKTVA